MRKAPLCLNFVRIESYQVILNLEEECDVCVCGFVCVRVCVHACVRASVRATHVIFSLEKVWGALAYSTSPCVAMRSAGVESVEWWSHPCHCVCMYAALHDQFR